MTDERDPSPRPARDRQGPGAETLFEAIAAGQVNRVKELLKEKPELAKAHDPQGNSAVLVAAYAGSPEIAAALQAAGAQVNAFEAAALGRTDLVLALLDMNPSLLRAFGHDGWTLLHLAAFFGHRELATALLGRGASTAAVSRNAMANQPLHSAVAGRRIEMVKILLKHGADVNGSAQGLAPLHLAAHAGHAPLAELLLAFGADTRLRDAAGHTPIQMAAEQGHAGLADFLKRF